MMTHDLALRIFADFNGQCVERWTVTDLVGVGGTSVVLLATSGTESVAIKVLAKDLTQGADERLANTERERLQRQLSMQGRVHPNIVRIRGSGKCSRTGYDYLIMDYVTDKTLKEILQEIPRERIRHIIQQVAGAALYLHEQCGHVHRDIKPANIAVALPDCRVTLLDLGVMRPVIGATATDQGVSVPPFVGTKRYAPPEFLDGIVVRDSNGWLAVTFYQLGGILHDLIMRKRLFDDLDEDEAIRRAVHSDVPRIEAPDVPADLVQLACDCLQKDPVLRRSLVSWGRFLPMATPDGGPTETDRLRAAVAKLRPSHTRQTPMYPNGAIESHARSFATTTVTHAVEYHLRRIMSNADLFPSSRVESVAADDGRIITSGYASYPLMSGSSLDVTIRLQCVLLDVRTLACRCELACFAGDEPTSPAAMPFTEVYRGSFVSGTFGSQVDTAVAKALAELIEAHTDRAGGASATKSVEARI